MTEKLGEFIAFLLRTNNIDVSKYDDAFLQKTLNKRCVETSCTSYNEYGLYMEFNEHERDVFISSLNVSYSEFFRNPLTFSVLEKIVIPTLTQQQQLLTKRDEIRIWSAACAGGQEVYSLSMLLNELQQLMQEQISFRIFASDICQVQVAEAMKGRYAAAQLNMLNTHRVHKWFTRKGDVYHLKSELKEQVDFSVFDLLSEQYSSPPTSIFGNFDIIVCANLLFYYKPAHRTKILEKLSHSLASDGYLITGETEREILLKNNYTEVFPHSAIFRRAE